MKEFVSKFMRPLFKIEEVNPDGKTHKHVWINPDFVLSVVPTTRRIYMFGGETYYVTQNCMDWLSAELEKNIRWQD